MFKVFKILKSYQIYWRNTFPNHWRYWP